MLSQKHSEPNNNLEPQLSRLHSSQGYLRAKHQLKYSRMFKTQHHVLKEIISKTNAKRVLSINNTRVGIFSFHEP